MEEAKAANEELQAMNEELRSAAEELETSKEELQSVNEELTTVNQELKLKIDELGSRPTTCRTSSTRRTSPRIFLDRGLRVKFFTMRARDIFNLLATDAGRPFSDITNSSKHEAARGRDGARAAADRRAEVETQNGRSYLMRVLPYRTADDRIDGVVLTFVELRERKELAG